MMNNYMRNINISANSVIDGVNVVAMRANIAENGIISLGKTIMDTDLYMANLEQCNADYAEFENKVREEL